MTTLRVMTVCSGNICRSPLAAVMIQEKLKAAQIPAVVISSGTLNINGQPAASHSQTIAIEHGLDLSHHRSQGISKGFVDVCNYVVCMSPKHADRVLQLSRGAAVVRLWEYLNLDEIKDPVGQSLEVFRECGNIIDEALDLWIDTVPKNA